MKKKIQQINKIGVLVSKGLELPAYRYGFNENKDDMERYIGIFILEINESFIVPDITAFILPKVESLEGELSYSLNKGMPYFLLNGDGFYEFHYVRAGLTDEKIKKFIKDKRIFIIK